MLSMHSIRCIFFCIFVLSHYTSGFRSIVRRYLPQPQSIADEYVKSHAFISSHASGPIRFSTAIRIFNNNSGSDKSGIPLKAIPILFLGFFGLFGSDIFNSIGELSGILKEQSTPQAETRNLKETSSEGKRGKLTRLTRKEINEKLAQVPLFYAAKENGAVFTEGNVGKFFPERSQAQAYVDSLKGKDVKLSATTMDQVYYPLIAKQQKLGSFIAGVAGVSDPTATYVLEPTADEAKQVPADWAQRHENDLPLYRVEGLAFQKPEGLEIPVFLRKEDALLTYSRLRESKPSLKTDPELQVFSVLDLVKLFSTGGFEGRAVEVYPSMEAVEAARTLIMLKQ